MHKRYHQKKHQFKYNVFNILINIDDLKDLDNKTKHSFHSINLIFFLFMKKIMD